MNNKIHYTTGECSLGIILVAESERGICAIAFGDDETALITYLHTLFPNAAIQPAATDFANGLAEVIAFVEDPQIGLHLPLDIRGTVFQQKVWQALCEIQPGSTSTYSELAARIDSPKAVRAVASACAANKLAVVIPCHRVILKDGGLAGYRWGVERKRILLQREMNPSDGNKPA